MEWISWWWNAETEAHFLTVQLTCISCSQNALLCKYALQGKLKAWFLCPHILSLAFLFRRCQLLRSLAMVLLRSAFMHWQLNLALQSISMQAVQTQAGRQGSLARCTPRLMLCTAATGQGHAWAEYPADSSASFQDTVRLQLNIVCCRVQNKCGAPLPPGALPQALPSCSALHPLSTGACSLKKIWYSALEF